MTDAELRNQERILESIREELKEVYRFRKDTVIGVNARYSAILVGRSGWVIAVAPVIRPSFTPPFRTVDIRISRISKYLNSDSLINNGLMLIAAGVAFLALRSYMGDPKVYLYKWIFVAGFLALMSILVPLSLREKKDNEKVFPPSETEHLRNRLKLTLEEVLKRSDN